MSSKSIIKKISNQNSKVKDHSTFINFMKSRLLMASYRIQDLEEDNEGEDQCFHILLKLIITYSLWKNSLNSYTLSSLLCKKGVNGPNAEIMPNSNKIRESMMLKCDSDILCIEKIDNVLSDYETTINLPIEAMYKYNEILTAKRKFIQNSPQRALDGIGRERNRKKSVLAKNVKFLSNIIRALILNIEGSEEVKNNPDALFSSEIYNIDIRCNQNLNDYASI